MALRWFLSDPVPPYARRVKQRMLQGAKALVPAPWHLEMANGLAVAERRGMMSPADADQVLTDIERLLGQAIECDPVLVPVRQAAKTARAYQLSAYDAVYLDLAGREALPLATLDDGLRIAAAHAGVALFR